MVSKITTPPTTSELIGKVNELVDDKQDTLVSGTNIKTVGGTSLLGSGNIAFPTIDSALSTSSTNAVQNKVITSALNGKLDGFTLRFAGNWTGGVHAVNFVTIDYSECNSENGVFIKFSMVNSHGNGQAGRFLQDVVLNVKYTGEVAGTLYRYFAVPIDQASSEYYGSHYYGDVFWVNDTTNKIVKFYVLMHQFSYTSQSPYFRLNASTKGVITQSSGGTGASEYSSGTRVWTTVNWFETDQTYSATSPKPQSGVAVASAISGKANSADLATVATSGSYNDLTNKPTIPTVNNATLTIQKNGTDVATFTANASSNVMANISVPNVTSTYSATGTDAVNGVAVSNAIAVKQDTLVSGTNIKTINGTSILGSGNITIETSSTPNVDGETISYNSSDALQAIAVKNVRDGSTLPIWHGTEQQWNRGVAATTWYYWQTSATAMWTASTMPSSAEWLSVTYGDGKFVAVAYGSNKSAYSTDGINWTASTLPSSANWYSVTYGDGKFVAVTYGSNKSAYSIDGINWTETTMPSSANWQSVTYGDGKFVAVTYNSDKSAYSTDGINWTETTMPSSANWWSVTYGDGKFVTAAYNSNKSAYSTDGINWTASTMPSSSSWRSVTYGDGKFVTAAYNSDKSAYSTDGINWTETTMPSSAEWRSVTYGDGKFVAVASTSTAAAYSTDGVNWTASTLPYSSSWRSVTYGDGKFVTVTTSSYAAILTIQYDKCYTDTANPTTSSTVYSEPEVTSSYSISSVTSGAITLSNNNTYYYNQSGNAYTYQSVGVAHPEYLCFIDGVGVKMGNTFIATNNSNNS